MDNGFNLNMLLESLSEFLANKVAEKLEGRVNGSGRVTRLLTVEQAAAYLGRTKEAVQHIVASGKLPTVRLDRRVFVDVDDLDQWIAENKRKGLL